MCRQPQSGNGDSVGHLRWLIVPVILIAAFAVFLEFAPYDNAVFRLLRDR